jgi:hypothetical protein
VLPVEKCEESEVSELSSLERSGVAQKRLRFAFWNFSDAGGAIGQGDQISRLFHEDGQISPLFHEGAQDVQLINLSILPPWVAGFRAAETKLVSRAAQFGAGL